MKHLSKLLTLSLVLLAFAACNNTPTPAPIQQDLLNDGNNRGSETINMSTYEDVQRFSAESINLAELETITATAAQKQAGADDDVAAVVTLFNNFMVASSEAEALDLNFSMSDEPVEDGIFVFTIESEQEKQLEFKMYDEEGFTMAANNSLSLDAGSNYKALNVNNLENGAYMFELKDDEGKKLIRKVTIDREE